MTHNIELNGNDVKNYSANAGVLLKNKYRLTFSFLSCHVQSSSVLTDFLESRFFFGGLNR